MEGLQVRKRSILWLLVLILAFAMAGFSVQAVNATTEVVGKAGDFGVHVFMEDEGDSVVISSYEGTGKTVTCPNVVTIKGKTFRGDSGKIDFAIGSPGTPFKGNKTVEKVIVPDGYSAIGSEAFFGCTALKEVVIGKDMKYIGEGAFANCPNLKTYRFAGDKALSGDPGIGKDASGNIMKGVTAYVPAGSALHQFLLDQNINSKSKNGQEITLITYDPSDDRAAEAHQEVKASDGSSGTTDPTKQYGADGTPCGQGARVEAANKAITAMKSEKDAKGAVFSKLRLKMKKNAKTSITLSWSKPSGAVKYVVYGNKCGKTKYVKLKELKGTSLKLTKVAGAKVKKGTYYKFLVVAVNKNKKVVSTSKTIHVATKGGKITNHKSVTVKVKKKKVGKVTVKKGKKVTLKAKGVKKDKKLKFHQHVKIRYESTNKKVATVSSKGVIKGVKKGKCKVYAYSQSGVAKAVTVIVK